MRKTAFIKIATLTVAGVLSQGAFAADGTINFTGEITADACSVSPNSQNLIVPLGKVANKWFEGTVAGKAQVGKKATPAKFTIDLLGCDITTIKNAAVKFDGAADLGDATVLRVGAGEATGSGFATGVAIELGDSSGKKINLGQSSADYALNKGDNSLKFQAAYVATKDTVTVGPANAIAQFTIAYK